MKETTIREGVTAQPEEERASQQRMQKRAKWYAELLEAIEPGTFMDKRTEEQAHASALRQAIFLRNTSDALYEQCKELREKLGLPSTLSDILPKG